MEGLAGEGFAGDEGEAVEISGGGVATEEAFGGEIEESALEGAGLGELAGGTEEGSGAEIDEDCLAGGEEDVGGFEVAVDNAALVGGGERGGELIEERGNFVEREGRGGGETLGESGTGEVGHYEEAVAIGGDVPIAEGDDAGVGHRLEGGEFHGEGVLRGIGEERQGQ